MSLRKKGMIRKMEENKYPCFEQGHIKNIENIVEIKTVYYTNIKEINNLIKNGWIYLSVFSDKSLLLGRPRK